MLEDHATPPDGCPEGEEYQEYLLHQTHATAMEYVERQTGTVPVESDITAPVSLHNALLPALIAVSRVP